MDWLDRRREQRAHPIASRHERSRPCGRRRNRRPRNRDRAPANRPRSPSPQREAEQREIGAGISLWPNAIKALRRLGIGDNVEAAGAPAHDAAFRTWRGAQAGASITTRLQGQSALRSSSSIAPGFRPRYGEHSAPTPSGSTPSAPRSIRTTAASQCASRTAGWSHGAVAIAADGLDRTPATSSSTTAFRATPGSPPGAASFRWTTRSAAGSPAASRLEMGRSSAWRDSTAARRTGGPARDGVRAMARSRRRRSHRCCVRSPDGTTPFRSC